MQSKEPTLFDELGIPPTNDFSKIRRAYKKKALLCHPDKRTDKEVAQKEFVRLSTVLEILSNEEFLNFYYESISQNSSTIDINLFFHMTGSNGDNKSSTSDWIKEGDFTKQIPEPYFNRAVQFYHPEPRPQKLNIRGFANGDITIQYMWPSPDLFDECMQQRQGFCNFTLSNNRHDRWSVGSDRTKNKFKLFELIMIIDKHDPLGHFKSEILGYLGLPNPVPRIGYSESLLVFKKFTDEEESPPEQDDRLALQNDVQNNGK